MKLIDFPRPVPLTEYHATIDSVATRLLQGEGCISVYQVGGLSSPGISDIDLVAVYHDNAICRDDPRVALTPTQQYLFPHTVFGTSETLFHESQTYTFFHNYRHIKGEQLIDVSANNTSAACHRDPALVHQAANEYLVRMYVNLLVERTFGVCKVRNLLLNAKALLYDVQFLGIEENGLTRLIDQSIEWRTRWFLQPPPSQVVRAWHGRLWMVFHEFLESHFETSKFYLPDRAHRLGRSIQIRQGSVFKSAHRGIVFPWKTVQWLPSKQLPLAISALHRLGQFTVQIPYRSGRDVPPRIRDSFDYVQRVRTHNQRHLPKFMPLMSSLVLQA